PLAKEAFARLDRKTHKIDKNEPLIDGLIRLFAELFHFYGQDTAMSRLFIQDLLFRDNDSTGLKLLHDELRERVTKLVSAAQRRKGKVPDSNPEGRAIFRNTFSLGHTVFTLTQNTQPWYIAH
ncbi:MAG: hypothetical protein ACI9J0_004331, partial [Cryomorphaceae bacterium]